MKTIGLVGGTSWYSTIDYYRLINELVNKELGGNEAAKMVLYSVNYGEIVKLTKAGNWDAISQIMCSAAKKLEEAGADCILLGANTMHYIADKGSTNQCSLNSYCRCNSQRNQEKKHYHCCIVRYKIHNAVRFL